jgi:hypothetical protein
MSIMQMTTFPTVVSTGLYAFSTVTFFPNVTGSTGPTLAQAIAGITGNDSWKNNTAFFNVTSGIQLWTVPDNGVYRILAAGSQGFPAGTTNRGASIRGDFTLVAGTKLRILTGQQPSVGTGGGGGTYVINETGTTVSAIYVIAGGGGGKSSGAGGTATVANSSNTINNGLGGLGNSGGYPGSAGGGFLSSGTTSTGSPRGNPGAGFLQGGAGGTGGTGAGGFGGGASGGADGAAGGGSGGGYSGGSAGGDGSSGQGGGSYPNGTNQVNTANANIGRGFVTITKL